MTQTLDFASIGGIQNIVNPQFCRPLNKSRSIKNAQFVWPTTKSNNWKHTMYVYFGSYFGVKGNILELFGPIFLYLLSGSVTSSMNK